MEHQNFNHVVFATLEGLVVHSSKESIFITTPLKESINCRSGLFQVDTRTAFFSVGYLNDEAEEGSINLNVTGDNGAILLKAEDGAFISLSKLGAAIHGPGDTDPTYVYVQKDDLVLGNGKTINGPLLGGKITLKNDSVIIQAGLTKFSITPSGVVIETGTTKFELSSKGINLIGGPINSVKIKQDGTSLMCAENILDLNALEIKINSALAKIKADATSQIESLVAEYKSKSINNNNAPLNKT